MARRAKKKKGSYRDYLRAKGDLNSRKKRSFDKRRFASVEHYLTFKRSMHRGHNED